MFIKSTYSIDFACVVYSRLKAFEEKRENKTHGKISHSRVYTVKTRIGNLTHLRDFTIMLEIGFFFSSSIRINALKTKCVNII